MLDAIRQAALRASGLRKKKKEEESESTIVKEEGKHFFTTEKKPATKPKIEDKLDKEKMKKFKFGR